MAYESFPSATLDEATATALKDLLASPASSRSLQPQRAAEAEVTHPQHASQAPLAKPFPAYIEPRWRALAYLRVKEFKTPRECATELGVSYQTVHHWLKKPLYQAYEGHLQGAYLESLPTEVRLKRDQVRATIEDNASEMFERLMGILETTGDQKLATNIAQDMLDRAGISAVQEKTIRHTHTINEAKLTALFERAAEIGQPIINVTAEPAPSADK